VEVREHPGRAQEVGGWSDFFAGEFYGWPVVGWLAVCGEFKTWCVCCSVIYLLAEQARWVKDEDLIGRRWDSP
jgi:hypothetical protein